MYALVDIGKPKEGINYYYGILNLETLTLSYFTKKEFIKFIQQSKKQIQGLKVNKKSSDFYIEHSISELDNLTIIPVRGISFFDDPYCYEAKHSRSFRYGNSSLSCVKEIEFKNLFKIDKIVEGVKFWYNGVCLVYKKKKKGFNLESTLKWGTNGTMTNERFIKVFNDLNKFYPIVSLYRSKLPFCKQIDLSGLQLDNITSVREFMWHSNSIKVINFGFLNLATLLDGDKIFHGNNKLEIIDMRYCIGDIQQDSNFTFCLGDKCNNCVLLLPKNAINLLQQVTHPKKSGYFDCTFFTYCGTLKSTVTYEEIRNSLNLFKSKQLLLEKDENKRNKPICFMLE